MGRHHLDFGKFGEHVLGQHKHHRAGAAGLTEMESVADMLGNARGIVDFDDPFRHRREEIFVLDLLEGLAFAGAARYLADQQDHRGRVLKRGVDADTGVAGAGAAGDEADTRGPGASTKLASAPRSRTLPR